MLAAQLYAADIITSGTRDMIMFDLHNRMQKNTKLLVTLESQLASNPQVFHVFVSALNTREGHLSDMWRKMEEDIECGK